MSDREDRVPLYVPQPARTVEVCPTPRERVPLRSHAPDSSMSRAELTADSLSRRFSADLADLATLAEIEPALAERIRAALTAQLAAWPAAVSMTEKALEV